MRRRFFAALCSAAAVCLGGAASARAATLDGGVSLVLVNGTHAEQATNASISAVPAPMLRLSYNFGRFGVAAEGIPPIGELPSSSSAGPSPLRLDATELSYLDGVVRYRVTNTTTIGVGETLYNQQSRYDEQWHVPTGVPLYISSTTEIDRSRVAGTQYELVQILGRTLRSTLGLRLAFNPHMSANLGRSVSYLWSNANTYGSQWFVTPESGSQIDASLTNTVRARRLRVLYGIRYLNLIMQFPGGALADRNTFWIPFAGVSTTL
jgi:hypothetical protein